MFTVLFISPMRALLLAQSAIGKTHIRKRGMRGMRMSQKAFSKVYLLKLYF